MRSRQIQILATLYMNGAGNSTVVCDECFQLFLLGLIFFVHPDLSSISCRATSVMSAPSRASSPVALR